MLHHPAVFRAGCGIPGVSSAVWSAGVLGAGFLLACSGLTHDSASRPARCGVSDEDGAPSAAAIAPTSSQACQREGDAGPAPSDGGDDGQGGSGRSASKPRPDSGSADGEAGSGVGVDPSARAGSGGSAAAGSSGGTTGAGGDPSGAGGDEAAGTGGTQAGTGGMQAGSGGTQAGTGGTQAGSGGTQAPPRTCYDDHPGALFCDGFEAANLGAWTHYRAGPDGNSARTTSRVHSGQGALDSIKLDPGDSDPLYADVLGGRISGHLYFRGYLYVPSSFTIAPAGSRASLLVLGENSGELGGLSLVLWDDALSLNIRGQATSDVKVATLPARDRWLCVQIDFEIAAAGNARLRIDGTLVAEGVRNTLMATSYTRLWAGVNWLPAEQLDSVQVFYDDVVVDTRDVGCE